jgi:hypothetical protein
MRVTRLQSRSNQGACRAKKLVVSKDSYFKISRLGIDALPRDNIEEGDRRRRDLADYGEHGSV